MDSTGAATLDQSPPDASLSDPLPGPRSPRPLFYAGSPSQEESESFSGFPTELEDGAGGFSTGDQAWTTEAPSGFPDDDDPTSSPTSPAAGDKPAALLSKTQLRATARTAVIVGTGMAHTVAAKTEAQRAVGLYLADDDDAKAIGDPLADIAHRRGDVVGGKLSPDANDLLRSMMGVAGFFAKQVAKIGEVRRLEAGATAEDVQHFTTPETTYGGA